MHLLSKMVCKSVFLYVDESGDSGKDKFCSKHYILSGLIVAQSDWSVCLEKLKIFRKSLKESYGINLRTEIHSSELIRINKLKEYRKIRKSDRVRILREYATEILKIFNNAKVINVCINIEDHKGQDIFELAWSRLLQRYDTFLKKKAKGVLVVDDTDSLNLQNIQRKMRV